jgi:hypothetical protein
MAILSVSDPNSLRSGHPTVLSFRFMLAETRHRHTRANLPTDRTGNRTAILSNDTHSAVRRDEKIATN